MTDDARFSLHLSVPDHVWNVLGKWYSTSGAERSNNPIRQGDFQTYADWWNDRFVSEED